MEDTQDLSACVTKVQENVLQWEDRLQSEHGGPEEFRQAVAELRAALDTLGRVGFQRLAQACEVAGDILEDGGRWYRFKQVVDKRWLTLWGTVVVPRRVYQEDHGGPSRLPVDERCGMVKRFMVPELERMTAFLGARLVPAEVEDSLGQVLLEPPSRTAIPARVDQCRAVCRGGCEPARAGLARRGAWKEAGVGMVATYLTPLDPETEQPERVDVRYSARMPEAKMTTLVSGLVDQTIRAMQQSCYDHLVVLADGRREIWRTVDGHAEFDDFIRILDFYHAAEHLSKAAEYLFGKASAKADRWFRSWRHKLRHEPGAVDGLIRSLSYHRRKLRRRSERYRQASTELGYFRNNRDKMEYARYRALGLIISSGPIEAAAKTIVGHRLKRSGMRWTREGGQHILNLRVQVQSKRWDAFWSWHLQQTTPITNLKMAA